MKWANILSTFECKEDMNPGWQDPFHRDFKRNSLTMVHSWGHTKRKCKTQAIEEKNASYNYGNVDTNSVTEAGKNS